MDPVREELGSQGFKKAVEGMLAGGVSRSSHERSHPGGTGNDNDHAFSGDKAFQGGFGAVQRPKEVYFHYPTKDRGWGIPEKTDLGDPGVIDQNINPCIAIEDGLDGLITIFFASHVACPGKDIDSPGEKIVLDPFERFFIHIQESNSRPLLAEAGSQGGADAAGSSGNDDYLIFHFSKLFIRRFRRLHRLDRDIKQ
jgi:hypothetical protein